MRIGELSRRTGISVRMLRYYEDEGLLAPHRTAQGYRDYGLGEVDTVRRIKLLGGAGMTLPTIRHFLPCALQGRSAFEPCDELRSILRRQIKEVDEKIEGLAASRAALAGVLTELKD